MGVSVQFGEKKGAWEINDLNRPVNDEQFLKQFNFMINNDVWHLDNPTKSLNRISLLVKTSFPDTYQIETIKKMYRVLFRNHQAIFQKTRTENNCENKKNQSDIHSVIYRPIFEISLCIDATEPQKGSLTSEKYR